MAGCGGIRTWYLVLVVVWRWRRRLLPSNASSAASWVASGKAVGRQWLDWTGLGWSRLQQTAAGEWIDHHGDIKYGVESTDTPYSVVRGSLVDITPSSALYGVTSNYSYRVWSSSTSTRPSYSSLGICFSFVEGSRQSNPCRICCLTPSAQAPFMLSLSATGSNSATLGISASASTSASASASPDLIRRQRPIASICPTGRIVE